MASPAGPVAQNLTGDYLADTGAGATIQALLDNQFSNVNNVNVNYAGATFDMSNTVQTLDQLTGVAGANLKLGYGTLTAGANNGTSTFAGNISGFGGNLIKTGTGVLTLSGTNTYTGQTTVNGGRLQLAKEVSLYNNTPASWTDANISVGNNATLGLNEQLNIMGRTIKRVSEGRFGEVATEIISPQNEIEIAIKAFADCAMKLEKREAK